VISSFRRRVNEVVALLEYYQSTLRIIPEEGRSRLYVYLSAYFYFMYRLHDYDIPANPTLRTSAATLHSRNPFV
jgi:hypothetical protein